MTTKHRIRSRYRIELRERDHEPAHVHLTGGGFDVSTGLETLESEGEWPAGVETETRTWLGDHRDELLKEWNKWHP